MWVLGWFLGTYDWESRKRLAGGLSRDLKINYHVIYSSKKLGMKISVRETARYLSLSWE